VEVGLSERVGVMLGEASSASVGVAEALGVRVGVTVAAVDAVGPPIGGGGVGVSATPRTDAAVADGLRAGLSTTGSVGFVGPGVGM